MRERSRQEKSQGLSKRSGLNAATRVVWIVALCALQAVTASETGLPSEKLAETAFESEDFKLGEIVRLKVQPSNSYKLDLRQGVKISGIQELTVTLEGHKNKEFPKSELISVDLSGHGYCNYKRGNRYVPCRFTKKAALKWQKKNTGIQAPNNLYKKVFPDHKSLTGVMEK